MSTEDSISRDKFDLCPGCGCALGDHAAVADSVLGCVGTDPGADDGICRCRRVFAEDTRPDAERDR